MLDVNMIAQGFLEPIEHVVEEIHERAPDLDLDHVMLVGAWCRDLFHAALGHDFGLRATRDMDLALALSGWEPYEVLANAFPREGDTGVGFRIAGLVADLLPFGELEDPPGSIVPPTRREAISVWAFAEIFSSSSPLVLSPSLAIRRPTIPGFAAAKLAAWLDRSEWREAKDANDLALIEYWYEQSKHVEARLYDTQEGQQTLIDEEADIPRAAARLLGKDVAATVGTERITELLTRWPGDLDMLVKNFTVSTGPMRLTQEHRRREVIDALTRGLEDPI